MSAGKYNIYHNKINEKQDSDGRDHNTPTQEPWGRGKYTEASRRAASFSVLRGWMYQLEEQTQEGTPALHGYWLEINSIVTGFVDLLELKSSISQFLFYSKRSGSQKAGKRKTISKEMPFFNVLSDCFYFEKVKIKNNLTGDYSVVISICPVCMSSWIWNLKPPRLKSEYYLKYTDIIISPQ